jgi:hypothetical protein
VFFCKGKDHVQGYRSNLCYRDHGSARSHFYGYAVALSPVGKGNETPIEELLLGMAQRLDNLRKEKGYAKESFECFDTYEVD